MAVVLDALAPLVKKMITDMLKEEMSMLRGVSGEISKLEGNLGHLQNFLTDAERRRITDVGVQAWVGKLKRAMYEAVDIVDLCQLEAMEHQEDEHSSGLCSLEGLLILGPFAACLGGVLQPFLFCMQNPGFAHEVASRIKKLNNELATIRTGADDFNFNINLSSYARSTSSSAYAPRREVALLVESDVVGEQIEKNTAFLLKRLIADGSLQEHDSSPAVKVVAIVGLGGIGKSTLAKKILAREAIKEEFKTIWLSVTQLFSRVDLLRSAITSAGGKPGGERDESHLVEALTDALSTKKFLLVLDDVWNAEQAWHHLLRDPVLIAGRKQPGSRVLVTTRKEDVVRRMGASNRDQLHVAKLDDEDAWRLLTKQVGVESNFDELKDIGMKIVKICDGLPLAIKVMGGLLSTRRPNEDDWRFVLDKNLEWQKEGLQEELNYSVSLSYDDLSPELKQCFLYYSLFPKGSGFIEDRVISMWISEGLVQHDRSSESGQIDLEKIGAEYHRQLVARHLLDPDDSTGNIWDYTLHDVVRSFAQFMAREEAFVVHKDQAGIRNLLPENQKFRRLSIELIDSELEWTILDNQETLRTLLINCDIKPGGSLANFASLRVLDIKSKESDWLVDSLCKLRHLRYLSFSKTNISRLPADIHKMRFLLHIQLDHCIKLDKLPDSITKLAHLRYLSIEGSNIDVVPRGFGSLTNLRTLYGFPVKMDGDWCTLEELGALSHLISLKIHSLENVPGASIAKRAKIRNKERLEYLELSYYKDEDEDDDDEQEEEEDQGWHGQIEAENIEDEDDEDEEEDGRMEDEKIEDGEDEDEEDGQMVDEKIADEEDEEEYVQTEDEKIEDEETEEGKQIEDEAGKVRQIGVEQQERIEVVLDELCPPPTLDILIISRYYGRRLPKWMHSPTETTFKRLKSISLDHLTYCTRLPDGLCRILGLEKLLIVDAPAIEHVGPEFQTTHARGGGRMTVAAAFPDLRRLELHGLTGWKEWDWEEEQSKVIAMPALEYLELTDCMLTHLPRGLASDRRHNLRTISLENLTLLEYVESFPSVVELRVEYCPKLKRITALSMLQTVYIDRCPELKLLDGVPVLDSLTLDDEPWKVTGTDATCTPKRYQDGMPPQLPQDLIITRQHRPSLCL